jgi:hypothetical protein
VIRVCDLSIHDRNIELTLVKLMEGILHWKSNDLQVENALR